MAAATEVLRQIFQGIANAIREKDGTTAATDKISPPNYESRIRAIQTGVDTSDATAVASDIASGKTAYGARGKITGTVVSVESGSISSATGSNPEFNSATNTITISASFPQGSMFKPSSTLEMTIPASAFGDATVADVASGRTFTSSAGLKLTGTASTGGVSTSDATATSADIRRGATAYISSGKVSGTMPDAGAISGKLGITGGASWNPSDPNRGSGTVTITGVNQSAGYTEGYSNGSITVTVPADRLLKGRTVMPTTAVQKIIEAEDIAYGTISVAGDPNLIPSNIKSGVSIFGVNGTHTSGTDTSDATATASDIASGKTAYGASGKITGTIKTVTEMKSFADWGDDIAFEDLEYQSGLINCKTKPLVNDELFRAGSRIQFQIRNTYFGNAYAKDVASGKTFTSVDGLKVIGTAKLPTSAPLTIVNNSTHRILVTKLLVSDKTKLGTTTLDASSPADQTYRSYEPFVIHMAYPFSMSVSGAGIIFKSIVANKAYICSIIPDKPSDEYTITIEDA